jgi:SAM-dependent methyltransferase
LDLRNRKLSPEQISELHEFIVKRKLGYQPFVFTDDLETGEGFNFINHGTGGNISWKDADPRVKDLVTADPVAFRRENAALRAIYDDFVEQIASRAGVPGLTFAEVGCNTGYFLYALALRGASRCTGYDFTENSQVFAWFNRVLGTRCEFHFSEWNSFQHRLRYASMPRVDVALSVAVTCHLADPIHHLTYLCERASKAIFCWCPTADHEALSITYGRPQRYPNALDWPLGFDNDVRISIPLLKLTLEQCGFEDIHEIQPPRGIPDKWKAWHRLQRGYIALRTSKRRTAYSNGRVQRMPPSDKKLLRRSVLLLRKLGVKRWG